MSKTRPYWNHQQFLCILAAALLILAAAHNPTSAAEPATNSVLPIQVEIFERMSAKKKVPKKQKTDPKTSKTQKGPDRAYRTAAFGFHRLPFKYDKTGVRELIKGPARFRATATLTLKKGTYRIVVRTRNTATLSMDERVLVTVKARGARSGGHNPVRPIPARISPMIKDFAPGNSEGLIKLTSDGLPHTFTLETTVGPSGRRPELGILAVAIAGPDDESFTLLGSGEKILFSNDGWAQYISDEEIRYTAADREERRTRSRDETQYWQKRHAYANQWLNTQQPVVPPALSKVMPVHNAIDRFIGRRLEEAAIHHIDREAAERVARSRGLVVFHAEIQPILAAHCLKCHGDKKKGDLSLKSREGALIGGESEDPALVAGHPEKSQLIKRVTSDDKDFLMPPKGARLNEKEIALLTRWIQQGAPWDTFDKDAIDASRHPSASDLKSTQLAPLPLVDDTAFLRRVTLDTVGVIPSLEEIQAFESDTASDKRARVIDRLLGDDVRWADHWVPFWQDLLAENPNIVKPNLNNTGAFRWWIHESFVDNKPMDRFLTDLVMMRGDRYIGPAGFGMATQNDVPMAAKAHILGAAFMGVQMRCARCHDAPFQSVKQEDLFNIAAMLKRKPLTVPVTSIVPADRFSGRKALVKVSLKPKASVAPRWPFDTLSKSALPKHLARDPKDPRAVLAAHMSSPSNTRFAKVMVNWVWKRYFGRGLVEPAVDWENADTTHPELLAYLAQELVRYDYDIKHVCRLILNSHTYQRKVLQQSETQAGTLFAGHTRRRMTAEQILDSLHVATGRRIDSEELNLDQDNRRPIKQFINLGTPHRAWQFTSLSNERDRPSLTLPNAQVYVDVLEAYGWNGSRQNPIYQRDYETNVLQPATIANGLMSQRLWRLSDGHPLTHLAMKTPKAEELVDLLFLKTLSRHPDKSERTTFTALLKKGFDSRIIPEAQRSHPPKPHRYPYVTWSNHLKPKANEIKNAIARDIEAGEPPTRYLRSAWRKNLEDGLWALINSPEMIFVP